MKVIWINHNNKKRDITNFVKSVTWQGSIDQIARQADIAVLNGVNDKYLQQEKVILRNGDIVKLYEGKKEIFEGQVLHTQKQSDAGSVTYNVFDYAYHIANSTTTKKYKKKKAETITTALCKEFNIPIGKIAPTRKIIKKLIGEDTSVYELIMKAYTKAAKVTHKTYIVRMENKRLNVYEQGKKVTNFTIDEKKNITNISYEESAESVVNQVVIYNSKGKRLGVVRNKESIEKFGTFQATYTKEKGTPAVKAAKQSFADVEKTITVDVIEGNLDCIAGNGVKVHDTSTNLNALFWIKNDSHTWENNNHTMTLELSYKKVWDEMEDD